MLATQIRAHVASSGILFLTQQIKLGKSRAGVVPSLTYSRNNHLTHLKAFQHLY